MPRFFFNVYNDEITMDNEGAELPDLEAARAYAVRSIRSLAVDSVLQGHLTAHHHLDILDEDRNTLATIRFDEAIELRP